MSDQSRRKLLKSIAAGSGAIVAGKSLPESWSRPVVDSVMLPVHAQTSQSIFFGPSDTGTSTAIQPDNLFANVADALVQPASAQPPPQSAKAYVCITDLGDGTVDVDMVLEVFYSPQPPYESGKYEARGIPADGTQQNLPMIAHGCENIGASLMDELGLIQDAHAGNVTYDDATISVNLMGTTAMGTIITGQDERYTLDYAVSGTSCDLPPLVCLE